MKKYVVELIGTFFLVLTIGCVALKPGDAGDMAPLAIGSILMAMIFAGGHISGGYLDFSRRQPGCGSGRRLYV